MKPLAFFRSRRPAARAAGLVVLLAACIAPGASKALTLSAGSRSILSTERQQLEDWCGGTLEAQRGRRATLQQLLAQAQFSSEGLQHLHELEQGARNLTAGIEAVRSSGEVADHARRQKLLFAQLDAEDAAHDVEVLHSVAKKIHDQGPKSGHAIVERLYQVAQQSVGKTKAALQLLQTGAGSTGGSGTALGRLQADSRAREASLDQARHQFFSAQRSLDVLTAALQDESSYQADLEAVCSMGRTVYKRLQGSGSVAAPTKLTSALAGLPSASPLAPAAVKPVPQVAEAAAHAEQSSPSVSSAAQPAASKLASPLPPPEVAAPAVPAVPAEPAPHRSRRAAAQNASPPDASRAPLVGSASPPAASLPQATKHTPAMVASRAAPQQVQVEEAAMPAASQALPSPPKGPASRHRAAVAAAPPAELPDADVAEVTANKPGPAADANDAAPVEEEPVPPPPQPPKPKHHHHKEEHRAAAPPPPAEVPEADVAEVAASKPAPAADADDDAPVAEEPMPPPPPPPKPKHHHHKEEHRAAAPPPPAEVPDADVAEVAASKPVPAVDADVAAPVAEEPLSSPPPPPKPKHHHQKGKHHAAAPPLPASDPLTTPSDYAVWTPDGETKASDLGRHEAKSVDAAEAMKSMSAMFDDSGDGPPAAAVPRSAARPAAVAAAVPAGPPPAEEPVPAAPAATKDAPAAGTADTVPDAAEPSEPVHRAQPPQPPQQDASADVLDAAGADGPAVATGEDEPAAPPPPIPATRHSRQHHKKKAREPPPPPPEDAGADADAVAQPPAAAVKAPPSPPTAEGSDGYAAWTPSDASEAEEKKKAVLDQMKAAFDSDDDDAPPKPAPARKHKKKHHKKQKKLAAPPPSDDDAGVVYDDDDLPKHHAKPIMEDLSGGWQSLMKKHKTAASKPKLDPDIAMMQSLYSNDGAMPSQYTAWSPGQADAASAAPVAPAVAAAPAQGANDQSGDDDDDDSTAFFQIGSVISASLAEEMQLTPPAFLQRTSKVQSPPAAAAHALLQQYAQVLQSRPLSQLATTQPDSAKLAALAKRLRSVDPLEHPEVPAAHGKEDQAVKWCLYFQGHEQSISPLKGALLQLEEARTLLANASADRAAVAEEVEAHKQLKKTVEADIKSLQSLLTAVEHAASTDKGVGGTDVLKRAVALEQWRDSHEEIHDIVQVALQGRTDVVEAHRLKLAELDKVAAEKDRVLAQHKGQVTNVQKSIDALRHKLGGIRSSCGSTLLAVQRKRHAGHMEAHAVDMTLKVMSQS